MSWTIKIDAAYEKELCKLDSQSQKLILSYLNNKIAKLNHPKQLGKPLKHKLKGLWRYRINKFRIICQIKEDKLIILVVKVAKRDVVYDD